MKINIITALIFLSVVSVAHASDTTIINNVSVFSDTGGNTALPGESITTGESVSEVYIETTIEDDKPTIIHEIETSESDNTYIEVVQIIKSDEETIEITTSTGKKADTKKERVIKENATTTEKTKNTTTKEQIEKTENISSNQSIVVTILTWINNFFSKIFS